MVPMGSPYVVFTLMSNSIIWANSDPLRDIRLQNFNDLESSLSRSLKAKCRDTTGLPIHSFLLMFDSNI